MHHASLHTTPLMAEARTGGTDGRTRLCVVVPCYNEEEILVRFHTRLCTVLDGLNLDAEVLYVDDGSTDATGAVLRDLRTADPRVAVLALSRNFGKEIALTAGLDHADADATVVIDADLQDPPELIPDLVAAWTEGADVVYARRLAREGESAMKRLTAFAFYRIAHRFSRVRIPEDTGDFRLLSRRAVLSLRRLREHHRFMKGLFAWIGYRQAEVPYRRQARAAGQTKWNYARLWGLALDGITSFTSAPLKIATYLGLMTAGGAFVYAGLIVFEKLAFGNPVPGYPSLMVVILFLGGVQLISIGIIGEYLGRLFDESKGRPLYLLHDFQPSGTPAGGRGSAANPQLPVPRVVGAVGAPASRPPAGVDEPVPDPCP